MATGRDNGESEKGFGTTDEKLAVTPTVASLEIVRDIDPEEERRLVRKLDMRILPLACFLYLFAYLDRSNLGNAVLMQLPQDTLGGDPTGILFDWVLSVFYFTYILCQVPATVLSKLFPPRYWMAGAAVGWGICSTLMASSFNFSGLIVTRFALIFLGFFEAGFGPAIPLYFSLYYTKAEMGLRMAYWFGFAAVAGAFGGVVAFGVSHADIPFGPWRLLFIVEGIPTMIIGILTLFLLPNRPESTTYLNEREQQIAVARMNRATSGDSGVVVNKAHIVSAFCDWKVYTGGVIYFGLNCALASISAFLPTILTTLGFSNANAQLLTVPPYAVAAVVLTIFAYISDKTQSRGILMVISSTIGGIGYILLLTVENNVRVRYFATFCITSGTYTSIGIIIAWFAHNLGSETKKATGIPIFMAIGQCGSILGAHIFPKPQSPLYIKGFAVSCALMFVAALCSFILTVAYRLENARRDKEYGVPASDERVDTSEYADEVRTSRSLSQIPELPQAPNFRYIA